MNFYQAFENVKNGISKVDTTKFAGNFAIQLTMTNKDCGGIFYVEYKEGSLNVEPYNYYDNNVSVTSGYSDLLKLLAGELKIASKKIEVLGDEAVLANFISAITFKAPAAAKKAAPKKPAAKAPAKKEAPKAEVKKAEVKKEAPKATEKKAEVKKEAPKAETKKVEVKKEAPKATEKKTTKK